MKTSRKFNRTLANLFDSHTGPIYVVDTKRQIRYMNPACVGWVRLEADDVENLQCFFTSAETVDPKDNAVKGLCPPPEIFAFDPSGNDSFSPSVSATVFVPSPDGVDSREAVFHRLYDEENQIQAVLVVVANTTDAKICHEDGTRTITDLSNELHKALAAIQEYHLTNYSMGNLIGTSAFAERLRRQTAAIIGLNAETLITGPPGSGREHLARTIATSCCDEGEFSVCVLHCVLADDELTRDSIDQVASKIAHAAKRGHSVTAPSSERATPILLLLDIDKLTRSGLLQVEDFLTKNGNACRVIATSETSLLELARNGEFPTSIAHQLTTIEVTLVSLSQRAEDIPLMAQSFVEHVNRTRETQLTGFDDGAMQLLSEFHWPGNLEQLQQVVVEACEKASTPVISSDDLPDSFRHAIRAFRIGENEETTIELDEWLEQLELELIQRAILKANGNKTKAASLLGISRSRMIRRLDHFDLNLPLVGNSSSSAADDTLPTTDQMIDPSEFEELE